MKSFLLSLIACFIFFAPAMAQDESVSATVESTIPYHQIPDYPEEYSAATVAARMIDGLGYRYYWATESLREEDLDYKPSEDSRTAREVLEHLHGLSTTILNAASQKANIRSSAEEEELSFAQRRQKTLENFEQASKLMKASKEGKVDDFEIIFKRGEKTSTFPFWNMLNGPMADAIYHVGQIVAYRRASGNPLNPRVSVFMGKTRGE